MVNIWFHGGGFASIWSYGVAEAIKRQSVPINFIGGYSAGAGVAAYAITPRDIHSDIVTKVCLANKYSPYMSKFGMIGKAHLLMKHLHEVILGDPLEFNSEIYNKKLWIPIKYLKRINGSWRNSWRDYDDLIDTFVSTTCFPGMHGQFPVCYYDDVGFKKGPTIDGGLFSLKPPKKWNKKDTIIVSPWGKGNLNMTPKAKVSDIAFPNKENLKIHFNLGLEQGLKYFS